MQVATHEQFARRLSACLRHRLTSNSMISGAVAPNRSAQWPRPHHQNRRTPDIIARCARTARKDFIEGRHDSAAFHLGVASHYALDNLVPHCPPAREHTLCESRFAQIDRDVRYPGEVQAELGDGRAAERAIRELIWVADGTPLNFEQRLEVAHTCLLRLGYAVTEDPEPLDVIQELADAFVALTSAVEVDMQRYRERAEQAFARARPPDGQAAEDAPSLGLLGRLCRPAVGRCARMRADGLEPAGLRAALARLGLWRLRSRLRSALEDALGPEENARQLEQRARQAAAQHTQVVEAIRQRRMYWDWFDVHWDFWLEKGPLAVKLALFEARKTQERLTAPRVEAFCAACAGQSGADPCER